MNNKMIYRSIPYVQKQLSRVVFGTVSPMSAGEDCFELLDAVYEAGINVFDTAAAYGEAEASLGRWIKARGLRDEVVILTKGANPNAYRNRVTEHDIMSDIEDSLAKLQTGYVDLYILHRDDPSVPVGPIVELLNRLHGKGAIGAFGGSNWSLDRTQAANAYAEEHGLIPFTVCSPAYSMAECIGDPWGGSVTISGDANKPFRDWLRKWDMPVFAYSSLARGFLSGKLKSTDTDRERAKEILFWGTVEEYAYPVNYERLARAEKLAAEKNIPVSEIAYAWLMQQPLNIFGITAPSSRQHIRETVEALHLELSEWEMAWLNKETDEEL